MERGWGSVPLCREALFALMCRNENKKVGHSFATKEWYALKLKCCTRTIERAWRQLEALGRIVCVNGYRWGGRGQRPRWHVVEEALPDAPLRLPRTALVHPLLPSGEAENPDKTPTSCHVPYRKREELTTTGTTGTPSSDEPETLNGRSEPSRVREAEDGVLQDGMAKAKSSGGAESVVTDSPERTVEPSGKDERDTVDSILHETARASEPPPRPAADAAPTPIRPVVRRRFPGHGETCPCRNCGSLSA